MFRTATNTAIIAPPDYRMSPSNSATMGFYDQFIRADLLDFPHNIKTEKKEEEKQEEEESYSDIEMDDSRKILK